MNMERFKLTVTFLEPVLGSLPGKDVATEYLLSKVTPEPADEAETLTADEALEKGTTVFHREHGHPILYNYVVKGFLKEAARAFNGNKEVVGGVKNLRSKIDNYVFVSPRRIRLELPEGGGLDTNERPLRAETAQGPRVALARSEEAPAGTTFTATLAILPNGDIKESTLRSLLEYGEFKGIGQWRNASYGSFSFTMEALED